MPASGPARAPRTADPARTFPCRLPLDLGRTHTVQGCAPILVLDNVEPREQSAEAPRVCDLSRPYVVHHDVSESSAPAVHFAWCQEPSSWTGPSTSYGMMPGSSCSVQNRCCHGCRLNRRTRPGGADPAGNPVGAVHAPDRAQSVAPTSGR